MRSMALTNMPLQAIIYGPSSCLRGPLSCLSDPSSLRSSQFQRYILKSLLPDSLSLCKQTPMGRASAMLYLIRWEVYVVSTKNFIYRTARIIRCGGAKIDGTPPTAQTPKPNSLKFFAEAPHEDTFRGIGGIFEFHLRSWDIGAFVLILEPFWGSKNTLKWAHYLGF